MHYAVHQGDPCLCSSFLQCRPLQLVQHFCDATCCLVISHDKAGRPALDHLPFPNVVDGKRVPDNAGILCYRSRKCLVAQILGLPWTLIDVPMKKSSNRVGFLRHLVNVVDPA